MIRTVIEKSTKVPFTWIDLVDATSAELEEVAKEFDLHPTSVADCLDEGHPPKLEEIGDVLFIIARAFDEGSDPAGDTLHELTRKIAIFVGEDFLITFHRKEQKYLNTVVEKYKLKEDAKKSVFSTEQLLLDVLLKAVYSYQTPLLNYEDELDNIEEEIFSTANVMGASKQIYELRRKISVMKKALWSCLDVVDDLRDHFPEKYLPAWQNVVENTNRFYSFSDDLLDSTSSLLNLQLSLVTYKTNALSHKTSEVIKVLTIFSVFFMPLTFIVGVYGMNFKHMPELDEPYGYYSVWGVMLLICSAIFFYFRKKGWLKQANLKEESKDTRI